MWDRLRAVDIEQAKHELERRRADILARHAREIDELQASDAEIETLHGLIAAFALKFKVSRNGAAEAAAAPATLPDPLVDDDADASRDPDDVVSAESSAVPEPAELAGLSDAAADADPKLPAAAQAANAAPPPRRGPPPPPPTGELPRTNFEAFSRAIAKASF